MLMVELLDLREPSREEDALGATWGKRGGRERVETGLLLHLLTSIYVLSTSIF